MESLNTNICSYVALKLQCIYDDILKTNNHSIKYRYIIKKNNALSHTT